MNIGRYIDHIVYAVPSLEEACDRLENQLGVRPVFGGHHLTHGTKNALLNIGEHCYLELLAVDTQNLNVAAPRWMGVDLIEKPRITRWALQSSNLEKDSICLQKYHPELGKMQGGQRKMTDGNLLRWNMILPTATPMIDLLPFMVDWQASAHHPTDRLAQICPLLEVKVFHPNPPMIQLVFKQLGIQLEVKKGMERVEITLEGKRGLVKIC